MQDRASTLDLLYSAFTMIAGNQERGFLAKAAKRAGGVTSRLGVAVVADVVVVRVNTPARFPEQ